MFNWLNGKKSYIGIALLGAAHALEKAGSIPVGVVDTILALGKIVLSVGLIHKADKLTAAVVATPTMDNIKTLAQPSTGGGGIGGTT